MYKLTRRKTCGIFFLVSEDFEDEDIDYELDTDKDGLPDYYEDLIGTDKNNPDTDGDGLPDGYEVFFLGTDPTKADSDDNGIWDGDKDFDNDGLTNLQDMSLVQTQITLILTVMV